MSLLKIRQFSIDQSDTFTFANANVTGNLNSGNANLGNLAVANYFSGDGGYLSNIQGGNVAGAVNSAQTAFSVLGANVNGAVAFANVANSVAAANVSGAVANANIDIKK